MAKLIIEKQWLTIAEKIRLNPVCKTVIVIGECDTGKSTFVHFLIQQLCSAFTVGYVDCDPGQSVLVTPATLGLGLFKKRSIGQTVDFAFPDSKYLRFVGSYSPVGHLLENVVSIRKLQEKAFKAGADKVIIDSCGYTQDSVARNFQHHCLDLAAPEMIIKLSQENSPVNLLANFARLAEIIHLLPSPAVIRKTPEKRRANREQKFRQYFSNLRQSILKLDTVGLHGRFPDFKQKETYEGLLIALCNKNNFVVVLGILTGLDLQQQKLTLLSPPFPMERITSVHFGSLYCSPAGEHRYRTRDR